MPRNDKDCIRFGTIKTMPELPDITIYIEALEARLLNQPLEKVIVSNPFVLRTFDPPIDAIHGHKVTAFRRLGKRIAIGFENEHWLVIHLMIAGRLHWKKPNTLPKRKVDQAAFQFESGTLLLTEAGSKRRASMHLVVGEEALEAHRPPGLKIDEITAEEFREQLTLRNHTLKRALTDPSLFSGIGNAYSDEILHHAGLSPIKLTQKMNDEEIKRLFKSIQTVMTDWIERLRKEAAVKFPEKVTAFRPEMAVHGKYGEPCPVCESPVQRIRYADNETNYCATCQTDGKLLADRSLSRLLKSDWPKRIEDLEDHS